MEKRTIDILGSCVTRDALNYAPEYQINKYFARSSLISIYSEPVDININEIQLASDFQKKMIYMDFKKEFRSYVKDPQADILIIDFIDERFKVKKLGGNSYVTVSNEFIKAGLDQKTSGCIYEGGGAVEHDLLWVESMGSLIEEISQSYKSIIIHRAMYKYSYRNKFGKSTDFENINEISSNNEWLNMYYDMLCDRMRKAKEICLPYEASETHIWGLSPFHYEEDYYKAFCKELSMIIS